MPPIAKGSWNQLIIVLGTRGTGKSTYALTRLCELRKTPAYVLAHDPGWRLPAVLPSGQDPRLERHETIDAGRRALGAHPASCHTFSCADGDEVLRFAERLAAESLRRNGGGAGTPVAVLLDEGVATAGASPYRLSPELREFIATCRHKHVGLIMTAQDPRYIHYSLIALCTELVIFRLRDEDSLRRLERMGVSSDELAKVRGLPDYQSITVPLG